MTYFLTTQRLGFRTWMMEDAELALKLWGDPEVTTFVGGPFSKEQILSRLSNEISNQIHHQISYWPIFSLETNEHIGCCGLKPYALEHKIYEMGFYLRRSQWGKGYATEAAHAVIDYAFNTLGANELRGGHHPENISSRHTLGKLGFRYTHDEFYPPTGLEHPSYVLKKMF